MSTTCTVIPRYTRKSVKVNSSSGGGTNGAHGAHGAADFPNQRPPRPPRELDPVVRTGIRFCTCCYRRPVLPRESTCGWCPSRSGPTLAAGQHRKRVVLQTSRDAALDGVTDLWKGSGKVL